MINEYDKLFKLIIGKISLIQFISEKFLGV